MDNKPLTRRNFLKQSAAALTLPYIIISPAFGARPRPPAGERLNLGCIGVGGQGTNNMRGFLTFGQVQVVAVCDVEKAHRQRAKTIVDQHYDNHDCATYNDFRNLLDRGDIDIIMVATPDHWHAICSIWAMRKGIDVYCEKPLSLTIAEGRAMANAAKRYGAVTQVGTWQRSIHKFQHAAELIKSGRLGKIHTVEVGLPGSPSQGPQKTQPIPPGFDYNMWLGQAPLAPYNKSRCHGAFRFTFDYSGGEICDWGAHHLDVAQWCLGKSYTGPVEIRGTGEFPTEGIWNTATKYRIEYKYADGIKLIAGTELPNFGAKFYGTEGRWLHVNRSKLVTHPADIRKSVIKPDEMPAQWVSGDHHGNFLECVKTRRQTAAPMEIGHRSIALAHLGNIAMLLGRKLKWNPDTEQFVNDDTANRMLSRAMRPPWHL